MSSLLSEQMLDTDPDGVTGPQAFLEMGLAQLGAYDDTLSDGDEMAELSDTPPPAVTMSAANALAAAAAPRRLATQPRESDNNEPRKSVDETMAENAARYKAELEALEEAAGESLGSDGAVNLEGWRLRNPFKKKNKDKEAIRASEKAEVAAARAKGAQAQADLEKSRKAMYAPVPASASASSADVNAASRYAHLPPLQSRKGDTGGKLGLPGMLVRMDPLSEPTRTTLSVSTSLASRLSRSEMALFNAVQDVRVCGYALRGLDSHLLAATSEQWADTATALAAALGKYRACLEKAPRSSGVDVVPHVERIAAVQTKKTEPPVAERASLAAAFVEYARSMSAVAQAPDGINALIARGSMLGEEIYRSTAAASKDATLATLAEAVTLAQNCGTKNALDTDMRMRKFWEAPVELNATGYHAMVNKWFA